MRSFRGLVIALCAALGGFLSFTFMPQALDAVYRSVQGQNRVTAPGGAVLDGYEVDVVRVPRGDRPVLEELRSRLQAPVARQQLRTEAESLGLQLESAVRISAERTERRAELYPLSLVTENGLGVILDVGDQSEFLVLRQRVWRAPGADAAANGSGEAPQYPGSRQPTTLAALVLLGLILGGALGDLGMRLAGGLGKGWKTLPTGSRVSTVLGVGVGILASLPFIVLTQLLGQIGPLAVLVLMVGFSVLGVYAFRSLEEYLPWGNIAGKRRRTGVKILDTNVLIDGRVFEVVKSGFLDGEVYVPGFVVNELQRIADSGDPLRRQRGRRGLTMLRALQSEFGIEVGTKDRIAPIEGEQVDARLVRLARALGADLVTNDYNLNQVAQLQEVKVLNVNDLALAVRTNILPGEALEVRLIKPGNQAGQAVGYLEDGTMVVVERGGDHVGEILDVAVTQVIQTERGKMIFAELPGEGDDSQRRTRGSR